MRKLFFILYFVFLSSILSALAMDQITMGLVPYNAGNNVNLKSENFPIRTVTSIEWSETASEIDQATYRDSHIVANGGVFGIPGNGASVSYNGQNGTIYYNTFNPLVVYIQCPSDFNYVCQSHNEFVRPFRLYVVKRYGVSNRPTSVAAEGAGRGTSFSEISPGTIRSTVEYGHDQDSGKYNNMWFDLLLALPSNEINSTGVVIDNVVYPLIASDDYTSSITIEISWNQPYTIVYTNGSSEQGEFNYHKSLTIPFSGYVDKFEPGESNISFSLSRLPGAANIDLNSGKTGANHHTDVANLDILVNFGNVSVSDVNREKVRIFLSSNSDPYFKGNEFTLVHEEYNGIASDNNSFRYQAIVRNTEGEVQTVAFDGTDFLDGEEIENYLTTDCHNENHAYNTGEAKHYHFHTFKGIIAVEVSSENDDKLMLPGRYESRIYVHVVVDE